MEINMKSFTTLLKEKFNGNQAEMARNIGVSKYQLNIILKNGSYKSGNVFLPARKPTKCSYHSSSDIIYSYINLLDELSLRDCNAIS